MLTRRLFLAIMTGCGFSRLDRSFSHEEDSLRRMITEGQDLGLRPEQFQDPAHRKIAQAAISILSSHHPLDLVSLSEFLLRRGALLDVGGNRRLATLMQAEYA